MDVLEGKSVAPKADLLNQGSKNEGFYATLVVLGLFFVRAFAVGAMIGCRWKLGTVIASRTLQIEPCRTQIRQATLAICCAMQLVVEARATGADELEFFEKRIRPVLVERCYECHSPKAEIIQGGLLLDTREGMRSGGDSGAAVIPGRPAESLLLAALRHKDDVSPMPPAGKLPNGVIDDFEHWIVDGAVDPRVQMIAKVKRNVDLTAGRKHWAFRLPERAGSDAPSGADWPRTKVDEIVCAEFQHRGLQPVADTPPDVLVRRAFFALSGLPPSPDDGDEFEAAWIRDRSTAFPRLVDRLLSSPRFGERWGRHWLDVVRYAESTGRSVNFPYNYAWRYRNYVIDAFNKDKPYDRFVREQIAGDLLPSESVDEANEQAVATGFLAIGPRELDYDDREPAKTERYFLHGIDEQIDVTTRGILALTVACAQCHDHKFDPILTTDYYALAGIFRSSQTLVGYVHGLGNSGRYFPEQLAVLKGLENVDYEAYEAYRREATAAWRALKKEMTDLWTIRRQEGQPGFTNAMRETQEEVVKDHRKRLDDLAKKLPLHMPVALGIIDHTTPADMRVYIAGDPQNPGPLVRRGFLQVIGTTEAMEIPVGQSGRLQLADWLVQRDNPLTARVMVNRIWHHLFGRGIVATVDNFGATGEPPSNLRLLDYLALRFVEQGWSVKTMIREIMLSRVYQLASQSHPANAAVDPDNHFHWRMNRRCLEVEALRDAMLATSGQLDLTRPVGSPLMRSGAGQIGSSKDVPEEALSASGRRRTVYQTLVRELEPEMLRLFDFPSTSSVHGRRTTTIVPTQALFFMNDPFVLEQSRLAAARLLARRELDDRRGVELAYRLVLGRRPKNEETQDAITFLAAMPPSEESLAGAPKSAAEEINEGVHRSEIWARFMQMLFASAEFRYIE